MDGYLRLFKIYFINHSKYYVYITVFQYVHFPYFLRLSLLIFLMAGNTCFYAKFLLIWVFLSYCQIDWGSFTRNAISSLICAEVIV